MQQSNYWLLDEDREQVEKMKECLKIYTSE